MGIIRAPCSRDLKLSGSAAKRFADQVDGKHNI
jgi:hypothetical protein